VGKLKDYIERTSYMTVGMQFVLAVFIGLGIGYWLDRHFKTFPWLTIIWFFIGLAAGFKNVYRELKKISK